MGFPHIPHLYQRFNAGNDTNGNPRRVFVVYSSGGTVLDTIDEGYAGAPQWVRQLHQLPDVRCSVSEYRDWLKMGASK